MDQYTFFAASDLVVVGHNPEMADIVNRRGEIYGEAWYIYAENAHGDRVRHFVGINVADHAERTALALENRMRAGKLPVNFAQWQQARPAYGSDAYLAYGQADDVALEAREAADECY